MYAAGADDSEVTAEYTRATGAPASEIIAAIARAKGLSGSIQAYLTDGLGLSAQQLSAIGARTA
jgi:hypothetical protein